MSMTNAIFADHIDVFGHTVNLPPLQANGAAAIKSIVSRTIADCPDWDAVMRALDSSGFDLSVRVNHHGPTDYLAWSLHARKNSWAAARMDDLTL